MVAAIAPDFGRADVALVLAGAQRRLQEKGYLLILGTIETDDPNQLSARFAQRGIEGVIAIDATIPLEQFPVTAVHLHSEIPMDSSYHEVRAGLAEIGQSAAEAIVSQIEGRCKPRSMPAQPKIPAHFDSIVAWARRGDSRESA
jgi:DNA-binding LacI/PurR family transcriptional regulator